MSHNLGSVQAALESVEAEFHVIQNDTGWCIEVGSVLSGDDLATVLRVAQTVANTNIVTIPNVGLMIQTTNFDSGDVIPISNEFVNEPMESEDDMDDADLVAFLDEESELEVEA